MKTIAFYNNKGGIGKTTFSVHVALYAAKHHIRTLAVGLDRQGDLCRWLAGGDCEVQDGLSFRHSDYLHVVYSPMELPARIANYDLVIADCPPAIEIVDSLTADMWLVPLDGRLAMENLGNIYPSLRRTKGAITLVLNRCDLAGKRVVEGLREAAEQIPNAVVRGAPIPASAAIAKAAEYFRPVWEVPYGKGTQGDRAIQQLCADLLTDCGFGGSSEMTQRNRKPSGLDYKMRPNPGARQPSGPAPAALNFLRDGGGLADDSPPSTNDPAGARDPDLAMDPEPEVKPPPNLTIAPDPEQRPRKKRRRTGAPRKTKSEGYALPPTHKRQPSRSNHFRLPADVEAHLRELATEYECSRTHVVCSVLSAEWQRLKRRQNRPTKTAPDA